VAAKVNGDTDVDLLRAAFEFLLAMGFREERSEPLPGGASIRYSSPRAWVEAWLSRKHCEADVNLGLAGSQDRYPLRAFTGVAPNEGKPPPVMFSRETLPEALALLADLTRKHGAGALLGDEASFRRARQPVAPLTFSDFVKRTEG
jgi:hypothetical protein